MTNPNPQPRRRPARETQPYTQADHERDMLAWERRLQERKPHYGY